MIFKPSRMLVEIDPTPPALIAWWKDYAREIDAELAKQAKVLTDRFADFSVVHSGGEMSLPEARMLVLWEERREQAVEVLGLLATVASGSTEERMDMAGARVKLNDAASKLFFVRSKRQSAEQIQGPMGQAQRERLDYGISKCVEARDRLQDAVVERAVAVLGRRADAPELLEIARELSFAARRTQTPPGVQPPSLSR
jgi:hypothetical protein